MIEAQASCRAVKFQLSKFNLPPLLGVIEIFLMEEMSKIMLFNAAFAVMIPRAAFAGQIRHAVQ